jgi:hypothetical protein
LLFHCVFGFRTTQSLSIVTNSTKSLIYLLPHAYDAVRNRSFIAFFRLADRRSC